MYFTFHTLFLYDFTPVSNQSLLVLFIFLIIKDI